MRKFLCFVLSLILVASLSISSFAAVLAEPCDHCNSGTVREADEIYGAWRAYDSKTCQHEDPWNSTDRRDRRTVTLVYECDTCIYSYEVFQGYEYRTYCNYRNEYV